MAQPHGPGASNELLFRASRSLAFSDRLKQCKIACRQTMKKLGKNNVDSIVKERKKSEIGTAKSLIKAALAETLSGRPWCLHRLQWDALYHFRRFERTWEPIMQGAPRSIWGQSGEIRGPRCRPAPQQPPQAPKNPAEGPKQARI